MMVNAAFFISGIHGVNLKQMYMVMKICSAGEYDGYPWIYGMSEIHMS